MPQLVHPAPCDPLTLDSDVSRSLSDSVRANVASMKAAIVQKRSYTVVARGRVLYELSHGWSQATCGNVGGCSMRRSRQRRLPTLTTRITTARTAVSASILLGCP